MTLRDLLVLAVVIAVFAAIDHYLIPAGWKWLYRGVCVVAAAFFVLRLAGVLDYPIF